MVKGYSKNPMGKETKIHSIFEAKNIFMVAPTSFEKGAYIARVEKGTKDGENCKNSILSKR